MSEELHCKVRILHGEVEPSVGPLYEGNLATVLLLEAAVSIGCGMGRKHEYCKCPRAHQGERSVPGGRHESLDHELISPVAARGTTKQPSNFRVIASTECLHRKTPVTAAQLRSSSLSTVRRTCRGSGQEHTTHPGRQKAEQQSATHRARRTPMDTQHRQPSNTAIQYHRLLFPDMATKSVQT